MMTKPLLNVAVVGMLVTMAANLHAGTKQFDLIVRATSQAVFDITGNPIPISSVGQVGDVFFSDREVYEADTAAEPPTAVGPELGRSLIECRVIAAATMSTPPGVFCQGSFAIEGRGFLTASGPVDLTRPENYGAVTGGTEDFSGVTGDFAAQALPGGITLYRFNLQIPPKRKPLF